MIGRLLYPPGLLALYLLIALARVAYLPVWAISPTTAAALTGRVERWRRAFTRWCLTP